MAKVCIKFPEEVKFRQIWSHCWLHKGKYYCMTDLLFNSKPLKQEVMLPLWSEYFLITYTILLELWKMTEATLDIFFSYL